MAKTRRNSTAADKNNWMKSMGTLLMHGTTFLLRALPMVLILSGAGFGVYTVWKIALNDPRFRIAGDTLSLSDSRRFCPEAIQTVERLGRSAAGRSLLDPCLLSELKATYEASSWIKRVCTMRRVFPNRLAVEFILRSPAAVVRQGSYYWTVDNEGMFLSVSGKRNPPEKLPHIVGTTSNAIERRPHHPGRVWQDPGVQDALGVLRVIKASPLSEDLNVRRVLVHGGSFLNRFSRTVRKRPRLDIETAQGVTIRWGTFNDGNYPDEMLHSEKVAMLRNLVARDFASIPGVSLDVRTRVPGFRLPRE